jgi:glycosyltransferase involved in cell wall biosynthesis
MDNNILIVTPTSKLGGAEQYLNIVAKHFIKLNYTVTIFILKKDPSDGWSNLSQYDNCHLVYLNSSNSEKNGLLNLLINTAKRRHQNFEYIFTSHVHITGYIGVLVKLGLIKTKKFVGRESTTIFLRFKGIKLFLFKLCYKFGYSSVDLLVCQTDLMKQQLLENLNYLSRNVLVEVIPNPIDLDDINIKSFESLPDNRLQPFIVSAGRLVSLKGFDNLIGAFAKLSTKFPNLNLVILGEGPLLDSLIQLSVKLGIEKKVVFPGQVKNVIPYFRAAEACIVSSTIEGFPNVLLQMMSQNNTIISTLCAGGIENIPNIYCAEINSISSLFSQIELAIEEKNKDNRPTFNKFLKERQIANFIAKVNNYLST